MWKPALILLLAAMIGGGAAAAPADYPTTALADYVFACMASNGQTRDMLNRCSCSIDVVASLIPYDKYVEAESVISLRQVPGERTAMFRQVPWTKEVVKKLREAQAEAEIRCF